jgi:Predicted transcriptional regulator
MDVDMEDEILRYRKNDPITSKEAFDEAVDQDRRERILRILEEAGPSGLTTFEVAARMGYSDQVQNMSSVFKTLERKNQIFRPPYRRLNLAGGTDEWIMINVHASIAKSDFVPRADDRYDERLLQRFADQEERRTILSDKNFIKNFKTFARAAYAAGNGHYELASEIVMQAVESGNSPETYLSQTEMADLIELGIKRREEARKRPKMSPEAAAAADAVIQGDLFRSEEDVQEEAPVARP